MNNSQAKKIRRLYNKDFAVKYKEVFNYLQTKKPWYIPKKLWIYWIN